MNEEIVDSIYNVLVERFGIGEVFLPKRKNTRPQDLTWKQFIKATLELEASELFKFCRYSSGVSFSSGLKSIHTNIMLDKGGRHWAVYLLYLVGYKRCSVCGEILSMKNFSRDSHTKDGLRPTCKNCDAAYYNKNKEQIKEQHRKYYVNNKEYFNEYSKEYYLNNKHIYAAYSAKRRATKLKATPKWANLIAIKEIYQTCPEGYHVDHIVPLQSSLVCGLHCEFNLQHLSAYDNLSKSNKFEVG
jgi:hypothetical protein